VPESYWNIIGQALDLYRDMIAAADIDPVQLESFADYVLGEITRFAQ
jgi:hypothetical protein